jgi:hypothetical protein
MAFASASAFGADRPAATYEMVASGEVQIAPDGRVSDYRLESQLAPAVAELVNRAVRGWRFEPILQDGKPVIAKSALRMRLTAERAAKDSDSFVVRVVGIEFGAPDRTSGGKPPRYPDAAVSARLNAKVMLALRLDETGKVVEAVPYQTSLGARARSERDAEKWRRLFERASIAAAKTWHYDLTETIGGKRIGTYALAPIVFSVIPHDQVANQQDRWQGYIPGPIHELPWDFGRSDSADDPASRLADGEATALNSRFRLVDDVVGKAL